MGTATASEGDWPWSWGQAWSGGPAPTVQPIPSAEKTPQQPNLGPAQPNAPLPNLLEHGQQGFRQSVAVPHPWESRPDTAGEPPVLLHGNVNFPYYISHSGAAQANAPGAEKTQLV